MEDSSTDKEWGMGNAEWGMGILTADGRGWARIKEWGMGI